MNTYYIKVILQTGEVKWVWSYDSIEDIVLLTETDNKRAAIKFPDSDIGIIIDYVITNYHVAQISAE